MKVKTDWHFTKWDGLNIVFVIKYIDDVLKIVAAPKIFFYVFLLKWRIKWRRFWLQCIQFKRFLFEAYFVFDSAYIFFLNGHIHNVVSTFPNIVKIDDEIDNVDSTLLNVVNFNVTFLLLIVNIFIYNVNYDIKKVL